MEAEELLVAVAAAQAHRELLYDKKKAATKKDARKVESPKHEPAATERRSIEPTGPDPKLTMTLRTIQE